MPKRHKGAKKPVQFILHDYFFTNLCAFVLSWLQRHNYHVSLLHLFSKFVIRWKMSKQ